MLGKLAKEKQTRPATRPGTFIRDLDSIRDSIRIRSEIRSGSDQKIRISGGVESGYPEGSNPDSDSKMLDPSKPDPDPDILVLKSGYPDP
uniref:Uncharacterized protein n=1 Tax=Brassica oleracea var. oleracea TaxID=109376 RepID=A0A0D3C0U3_BRAOL